MNWTDYISALLRQLTDFFGASHPVRVGIGVCAGIVLHGVATILNAVFPEVIGVTSAAGLNFIYYVAASLVLVFIPVAFGGRGAPEDAVHTIRVIRALMDAANYSPQ